MGAGPGRCAAFPDAICDAAYLAHPAAGGRDLQGALLHAARMRPDSEILDALDQHYRLHWIVRQAQVQQQPAPAGLNADVLMERHHALNWLVLFEGNDWDDVDTPT
ncbi:Methionine--tRNA ligase, mitochondrial [Manis javanica]|nr:Methionine--tRNA ligase, mitochondrial [Manis javanica]